MSTNHFGIIWIYLIDYSKYAIFITKRKGWTFMEKISSIIKKILKENKIRTQDAAYVIECATPSFRNKLSQNRFTIEELITLAELCDYHVELVPADKKKESISVTSDYLPKDKRLAIEEYKANRLFHQFEILEKYLTVPDDITNDEMKEYSESINKAKEKIYKKYNSLLNDDTVE